jgi:DNA-binding CsgD family transcriptional regulator/PAS domain-containing protein
MSLGVTAARKRTRDLAEFIRSGAPKGADVLDIAARELAQVLDTEQAIGIRLDVANGGVSLASVRSPFDGASRVERPLRELVERHPRSGATFDPTAPDPAQRNVVLSLADLQQMTGRSVRSTPVGQLLLHSGFSLSDVVRTLLCDGPSLLAWFGAFRDRPFDDRERMLLSMLVRPLRDRLTLQGRLAEMPWVAATMKVVLESTGAATMVFRRPMRLLYCNAAAQVLLKTDRTSLQAGLREELAGRGNGTWLIHPLPDLEGPEHFLAMRRLPPCDPAPRVALALTRMGLTPRQAAVLGFVAQGQSNRVIATALSCSESAVEQHVSALLRRYDVESRAELVARFWTDAAR